MRFLRVLFLPMLALMAVAARAADAPPPVHLVVSPCDAGEHYQFEAVSCAIELKNTGSKPIHVSGEHGKTAGDTIAAGPITVPPNGTSYIEAHVALNNSVGETKRGFRLTTDEPGGKIRGALVTAFVLTVLDQDRPAFDFGTVDLGDKKALPERSVTLTSREAPDFRVLEVLSKPDYVDVRIEPDGHTVHAQFLDSAPWGLVHFGYVKLKTNAKKQGEAWIQVKADAHGAVVPDSNPYALGLMRRGSKHEYMIRLASPTGEDFKVGKIELEGIRGHADTAPCVPPAKGCRLVKLTIDDENTLGKVEGYMHIDLPDSHKQLPIDLTGMLLAADTPVRDLDELMKKASAEGAESKSAGASNQINLSNAIHRNVRAQDATPPPGNGPLLRWSVAHQNTLYGYLIYRADSPDGPFRRINEAIIRIESDSDDASGAYQWRDNSAESGKTYWYSIGTLKKTGEKEQLTGPQKVVAK